MQQRNNEDFTVLKKINDPKDFTCISTESAFFDFKENADTKFIIFIPKSQLNSIKIIPKPSRKTPLSILLARECQFFENLNSSTYVNRNNKILKIYAKHFEFELQKDNENSEKIKIIRQVYTYNEKYRKYSKSKHPSQKIKSAALKRQAPEAAQTPELKNDAVFRPKKARSTSPIHGLQAAPHESEHSSQASFQPVDADMQEHAFSQLASNDLASFDVLFNFDSDAKFAKMPDENKEDNEFDFLTIDIDKEFNKMDSDEVAKGIISHSSPSLAISKPLHSDGSQPERKTENLLTSSLRVFPAQSLPVQSLEDQAPSLSSSPSLSPSIGEPINPIQSLQPLTDMSMSSISASALDEKQQVLPPHSFSASLFSQLLKSFQLAQQEQFQQLQMQQQLQIQQLAIQQAPMPFCHPSQEINAAKIMQSVAQTESDDLYRPKLGNPKPAEKAISQNKSNLPLSDVKLANNSFFTPQPPITFPNEAIQPISIQEKERMKQILIYLKNASDDKCYLSIPKYRALILDQKKQDISEEQARKEINWLVKKDFLIKYNDKSSMAAEIYQLTKKQKNEDIDILLTQLEQQAAAPESSKKITNKI